jgi:hypothetical protein
MTRSSKRKDPGQTTTTAHAAYRRSSKSDAALDPDRIVIERISSAAFGEV